MKRDDLIYRRIKFVTKKYRLEEFSRVTNASLIRYKVSCMYMNARRKFRSVEGGDIFLHNKNMKIIAFCKEESPRPTGRRREGFQ